MSEEDYRRGVRDGRVLERELIRLAGSVEAWERFLAAGRLDEAGPKSAGDTGLAGGLRLVEPLQEESA